MPVTPTRQFDPGPPWPDTFDLIITFGFFGTVLVVAALGYFFMVCDYRAYLRSLRRALVLVVNYLPDLPNWARTDTPRCIAALGLRLPCTEDELKQAYREKVKELHPDRAGGDKKRFLHLQAHFEEALKYVGKQESAPS